MDWALLALGLLAFVGLVVAAVVAGELAARLFVEASRTARPRKRP